MEAVVIDTVAEGNLVKIPQKFRDKRVRVIIIDSEEEDKGKGAVRKLNFKIDETLEDVVPFADIKDAKQFAQELREKHWQ
jgi:hypothetical protein